MVDVDRLLHDRRSTAAACGGECEQCHVLRRTGGEKVKNVSKSDQKFYHVSSK